MKKWFKKNWKDCLVIFIIFCVFGTFCVINIKADIAKKERRKERTKLLQEIEEAIDHERQFVIKLIERCEPCLRRDKE